MNKDIVDFYKKHGHQVHKVISRRPNRISRDKVIIAMEEVYQRVKNGEKISSIMLAREVWRTAFEIPDTEMEERLTNYKNATDAISSLQSINKRLMYCAYIEGIIMIGAIGYIIYGIL